MGWRERLRPASFRGVPFHVLSSSREGGRRVQVTEFPGREIVDTVDLGRRATRFRVTAILIGDDYDLARDRLVRACESPGPGYPRFAGGKFRHPTYGDRDVVCERVGSQEDVDQLGAAFVDLDFVEASSGQVPLGTELAPPSEAAAEAAAASAASTAATSTAVAIETAGQPEVVRASVAAAAAGSLGAVQTSLGLLESLSIPSSLPEFGAIQGAISLAKTTVSQALSNAAALATTPADLVLEMVAAVESIGAAASNGLDSFYVYEHLIDLLEDDVPTLSSSTPMGGTASAQAAAKAAAVGSLAVMAAASFAVPAAVGAAWPSRTDAEAARDRLLATLGAARSTASDAVAAELARLRQLVAAGVPSPDLALPSVRTVVPLDTTSSLLLAYDATGDVASEPALVARNRLRDPGFIAAGTEVEVLVSA